MTTRQTATEHRAMMAAVGVDESPELANWASNFTAVPQSVAWGVNRTIRLGFMPMLAERFSLKAPTFGAMPTGWNEV